MRIGLSGYGRMGEQIREEALRRGHEVPVIIDPLSADEKVTRRDPSGISGLVDAVIEFSVPDAALANTKACLEQGIPVVLGTTGWYDQMGELEDALKDSSAACIWSGNFSLGVNLFFRIVRAAGRIMNRFDHYDCLLHEYHHRGKADSPSGTAEMLGGILLEELDRKTSVNREALHRKIADEELHLSSSRGGSIPGTHRVMFDSEVDSVVLEHSARSRAGFAQGAVLAAEWIPGKTGLFSIDDMMKNIIEGE